MRVLFEALQISDISSEVDATMFSSLLPQLFSGVCADILKCSQCGHKSTREDVFYDLCLPVQGMSSSSLSASSPGVVTDTTTCTPLTSLHRSLRSFLSEEFLTGSDQWSCSGKCNGAKVDAHKLFTLTKLPPVMTIHLKRFSFDASAGKFAKVNDPFSFPLEIDFDGFLSEAKDETLANASVVAASLSLPISSATPPLPSTGGSARSAVHALRARRVSLEADALAALSKGDVLSEEEEEALELMEEREKGGLGDVVTSACDSVAIASSTVSETRDAVKSGSDLEASTLPLSVPPSVSSTSQNASSSIYELYSILMHSGVTSRGHYFAFIRSPHDFSSSTSQWLLMNDSTVLPLTESEVLMASGALSGIPSVFVSTESTSDAISGNAKSIPPGGSPYMLLYRRKSFSSTDENSSPISLPPTAREAISDSALIEYGDKIGCGYLASEELAELADECKSFNALKNCHKVRQLLCELKVRLPKLALSRDDEADVLREASQHMQSSSTETATIYRLPYFEDDAGQPDFSSLFVPLSSSIDSATAACYSLLIETHGGKSAFKNRNCLIELPKLTDIRLRLFDAHTKKKTESYSHTEAPLTPFEANWGLSVDVAIEIRAPVDAIQLPWPIYDPQAISVRVLKWTGSSSIQGMIRRLLSIAEGTNFGEGLSSSTIPLDGRNAAILELSGPEGAPATVFTLLTSLVDSILDPAMSCSSAIPKSVHAVILPGGLPTPSDIASGVAAGRLRQRISFPSESSLTPLHSAMRVISIPVSGGEIESDGDVVTLMNMELMKSYGLCDGDDLIILQESENDPVDEELERSLPIFKSLFSSSTIRITFNAVVSSYQSDDDAVQTLTLTARRDETLLSLKRRMIESVNALSTSQVTLHDTHLKRNTRSPMLRDEEKSLRDSDIGDGAMLYICQGPVLIDDTTNVRVLLHTSRQQVVCSVPMKLSSRTSALKKKIFETLTFSSTSSLMPLSSSHLRLRGRQTASGASTSSILRDEAVLRQALGVPLSYSGGDDERDVFVEFLSTPETFGKDDLLVRVTEFVRSGLEASLPSHLTPLIDMVIPKASTLSCLTSLLTGRDTPSNLVRVAKHSAFGPVLNAWEAENKIQFVSIIDDVANISVCDPPLGLRDGCTLLWRRDAMNDEDSLVIGVIDSSVIEDNKENGARLDARKKGDLVQKPWLMKKGKNSIMVDESPITAVTGGISIRVKGSSLE